MHVVEVDRLCSTTSHTDTQVLTHSQLLPPSEWTSQSWAVQHLDGLAPHDACVMALMRHEKAGADDVDHQFQPLWSKAYADFAQTPTEEMNETLQKAVDLQKRAKALMTRGGAADFLERPPRIINIEMKEGDQTPRPAV